MNTQDGVDMPEEIDLFEYSVRARVRFDWKIDNYQFVDPAMIEALRIAADHAWDLHHRGQDTSRMVSVARFLRNAIEDKVAAHSGKVADGN